MKKIILVCCLFIQVAVSQDRKNEKLYQDAVELFARGDYNTALTHFLSLESDTGLPKLNQKIGFCYYFLNDYRHAEKYLKKSYITDSTDTGILLYLARVYKYTGKTKISIEYYEKLKNLSPTNRLVIDEMAVFYYEMRKYDTALKYFSEGSKLEDPNILHYKGMCSFNLGKIDSAILCFEKALSINPELAPSLNSLGRCYFSKKKYDNAILRFTQSLKLDYEAPSVHASLADCFYKIDKIEEAIISYKNAFNYGDSSVNTLSNIAWGYFKINRLDSSIIYLKKICANSKNGKNFTNLANVCLKNEDYISAQEYYIIGLMMIEYDELKDFSKSYVFYGISLHQSKNYKEAIEQYKRAIELNDNNALAYYNLAVSQEVLKNKKEAIKNYEKYIKIAEETGLDNNYLNEAKDRIKILK